MNAEPSRAKLGAWVDAALLFSAALILRALALRWFAAEPVWDGHYYDFGARRIATGHGYSEDVMIAGTLVSKPWSHYPVGYSGFLALVYRVFGASDGVRDAANVLVGSLLAPATYAAARTTLRTMRARIAGALVAIHPGLVLYSVLTMSELLGALLVMIALALAARAPRETAPQRQHLFTLGAALVLGLGALVRPQALLVAPVLGWIAVRDGVGFDLRAARAIAFCGFALLPVVPWSARNCRVMDGCALVSTNAGWNLAIGSFPRATGRFETLQSSDGCSDVTGQVMQDKCWLNYGLEQIRRAPKRWLGLVPTKLAQTFDHESFAIGYLAEANADAWPAARREDMRTFLTSAHRLLLVAAALGSVAWMRLGKSRARISRWLPGAIFALVAVSVVTCVRAESPLFWPIALVASLVPLLQATLGTREPAMLGAAAIVGTTALTHIVFFGEDRYHVAAIPALCLFSAGLVRGWRAPVSWE